MHTPREIYQQDLAQEGFEYDSAQALIVQALQSLFDALNGYPKWYTSLPLFVRSWINTPKGIYIWGDVGRGKTYLTDTFYHCLPFKDKIRLHYHRFMQRIHHDLERFKGTKDPLFTVAKKLAKEARIIVLDEFFINDIADAMIFARLLQALFKYKVALVTTGNIAPDDLYKDGLQRSRFLPAIALIKAHMHILNVDGETDYRMRTLEFVPVYYTHLSSDAQAALENNFQLLAAQEGSVTEHTSIQIAGRPIAVKRKTNSMLWCDFKALCDGPRSQNDYIEIARQYNTLFIENIFIMHKKHDDITRRFINLIDELYDRKVKVIIAAEAEPTQLYKGKKLCFEYRRTCSRLQEMQSKHYLKQPHTP